MTNSRLYGELLPIVRKYGFGPVERVLQEIGRSECTGRREGPPGRKRNQESQLQPRKQRVTASEYVLKMQLHPGKRLIVSRAAELFERRLFLPTIADIQDFFLSYDLGGPKPKARASAVPSIFSFISTMDTTEIEKLLNCGLFSGPTELGPIADAIRTTSKENPQGVAPKKRSVFEERSAE